MVMVVEETLIIEIITIIIIVEAAETIKETNAKATTSLMMQRMPLKTQLLALWQLMLMIGTRIPCLPQVFLVPLDQLLHKALVLHNVLKMLVTMVGDVLDLCLRGTSIGIMRHDSLVDVSLCPV